jgi:hypothetical protein
MEEEKRYILKHSISINGNGTGLVHFPYSFDIMLSADEVAEMVRYTWQKVVEPMQGNLKI